MPARTLYIAGALLLTAALATSAYAQHRGGGGGGGGGFRGGGGFGGGGMGRGGGMGGGMGGGGFGGRAMGAPGIRGGFGGRAGGAPQIGGGVGRGGFTPGQAFRPGFIQTPGARVRHPTVGNRVVVGTRRVVVMPQGAGVSRFGNAGQAIRGGNAARFAAVGPSGANLARAGLRPRTIINPAFQGRIGPRAAGLAFRGGFWRHHFRPRARFFAIGFVGPLFWPYAYDDFYDYVFLPHAYDEFWPYAYDDVFEGMFGPYYASAAGAPAAGPRIPRGQVLQARAEVCGEQLSGLTDLPIQRIAETVQPNEGQRAALEELKAAAAQAGEILHAACPTDLPSTPPGRMEAMEKRLAVMLQAVQTVRPKLEAFFQSLTDEQKARFNAVAQGKDGAPPAAQEQRDLTRMCSTRSDLFSVDRIAQAVQPNDTQRPPLEELKAASAKAADLLRADCPTYQALTPTGRAEAMEKRLTTVVEAVRTVRPSLETFWNGLSDEQKARFSRMNTVAQR